MYPLSYYDSQAGKHMTAFPGPYLRSASTAGPCQSLKRRWSASVEACDIALLGFVDIFLNPAFPHEGPGFRVSRKLGNRAQSCHVYVAFSMCLRCIQHAGVVGGSEVVFGRLYESQCSGLLRRSCRFHVDREGLHP